MCISPYLSTTMGYNMTQYPIQYILYESINSVEEFTHKKKKKLKAAIYCIIYVALGKAENILTMSCQSQPGYTTQACIWQ